MRVRYTPRARSDLRSILEYIDDRSPRGARSVKRAIQTTVGLNAGFAKEIDHLLTRVAEIEKHLGIDKKMAA